ncbi:NAD-dependent epimerase/dehydratase family protein [Pacificoceanicola onchidii]|uniref:NAD-dependent epimerase/dehydratase family protein n=1 Tax=Pacificoceanicola onchidii TaxID=2562685 RepID=UPI0023EF562A|nr:NAD(P)-dependent oxidoreductase [Pacificoceanicola onchidii]
MLGASGKLGRMLRAVWRHIPQQDYEIIPVFRTLTDFPGAVTWQPGEDAAVLPRIDSIISVWGVTRGDDEALSTNARLAVAAMDLATELGAERVLHASTQAIYKPKTTPINEDSALQPANAYGLSKLLAERAVTQWRETHPHGPRAVQLRIGNVAGAESLFANLSPEGTVTLDQFADGSGPSRSYIAPQDLATCITGLLQSDFEGPINVAAPQTTSMEAIARAAGADVRWKPAPPQAMQRMALDTTRLDGLCALSEQAADPVHLVEGAQATGEWP